MHRWRSTATGSLVALGLSAFTIWVHYEVKVGLYSPGRAGSVQQLGYLRVGGHAPDLTARDLSGRQISLASLRGRSVVLLDFWATWCGPCRMSLPTLQKIHEDFALRGVEVVGVNQGEPEGHVRDFLTKKNYAFRVIIDETGAISDSYGVQAIPTSVLIDKRGVIRGLHVGFQPDDREVRALIQQLISE